MPVRFKTEISPSANETHGGSISTNVGWDGYIFVREEQYKSDGSVNPVTTREFQIRANIALRNLVKQALVFDRDQMQKPTAKRIF